MTNTLDLRQQVMRQTGGSEEDAERLINDIATETAARILADQQAQPAPQPQRLQPISVTFTAEVDMDRIAEMFQAMSGKGGE